MKFLPLVWRNLLRRKVRTAFTLLSVVVAFVLFGLLAAIRMAFGMGVEIAGNDRLITIHKISLIMPLPESYKGRIEAVDGVQHVAHATWFGGIYQDARNFFPQMAVDPEDWLGIYPEYRIPDEQKAAWAATRTGAVAGRALADRFGWQIGDRIPIQGTIWRTPTGGPWEFTLTGIYDGDPGTDTSQFFFHHTFLDEARTFGQGTVGWYVVQIADPDQAPAMAERIDGLFANSSFETKTATEKAFVQGFANQVGDIGAIMTAILVAVLFTILLVAGNTMAQAVRERTSELAVLKTLGFSDRLVLALVLLESCLLAGAGGLAGLGLAWVIIGQGDPTGGLLPGFYLPARDLVIGLGLVVLLGLASGSLPAVHATRLRIVDALRRS